MKIIQAFPPNFAAIHRVFPGASGEGVIFAYAPDIYSMYVTDIPPELIAHESVHIERQAAHPYGVEAWWYRYLYGEMEWRYNEELLAHRAEYQKLCEIAPTRHMRRAALKVIGRKLAAPLYGKMVTTDRAMKDIAA